MRVPALSAEQRATLREQWEHAKTHGPHGSLRRLIRLWQAETGVSESTILAAARGRIYHEPERVEYRGQLLTLPALARAVGIGPQGMRRRWNRGLRGSALVAPPTPAADRSPLTRAVGIGPQGMRRRWNRGLRGSALVAPPTPAADRSPLTRARADERPRLMSAKPPDPISAALLAWGRP